MNKLFFKNNEYKEIISEIKKAESILLFTHVNPDGDALGALISLKRALQQLTSKKIYPILMDLVHHDLDFLPNLDDTIQLSDFLGIENFDYSNTLSIAVDAGDLDRLGEAKNVFLKANKKAQFDHHETNTYFAEINIVDASASSSASMIYYFFKKNNLSIDKDTAIAIYTGIATDTGNFAFINTDYRAFEIMADLMKVGLPLSDINYILFKRVQVPQQKILGRALDNLSTFADGKAAYFFLSKNDFIECDAYSEHITNFANQLIDIEGVVIAFFIYEKRNGAIKVSFRSKNGYRVDEIAAMYDGGGHKYASGCTMNMSLDKSISELKNTIENYINK